MIEIIIFESGKSKMRLCCVNSA